MLKNYLKIAWRRLIKDKRYVVTNILGLTVGIAACILIGLYVRQEFSYDTYHQDSDRMYRLIEDRWLDNEGSYDTYTWGFRQELSAQFKKNMPEIESLIRFSFNRAAFNFITKGNRQFREKEWAIANSSIFDFFTLSLKYGTKEGILDRPNTIVLNESFAKQIFGDQNPVGETVTAIADSIVIENRRLVERIQIEYPLEVTGVFQDMPHTSHFLLDGMVSFSSINENTNLIVYEYLKLKEGVDANFVADKMNQVSEMKHDGKQIKYSLQPLTDIYFGELSAQRKGDIRYVYLFSAIALFILLIAIINYVNLATARGGIRAKEVGVRKVSGASRWNLVQQFMGEALIYIALVVPLALALVELLLPAFNGLMDTQIQWSLFGDFAFLWVLIGFMMLSGLAAAIYPAFVLSSFQPADVMKGTFSGKAGGGGLRKFLIVTQFVISSALIIATLTVIRQMQFVQNKNLGFEEEQVVSINLGSARNRPPSEVIKQQYLQNEHVADAALSFYTPGTPSYNRGISGEIDRLDSTKNTAQFKYTRIEPGFISLMGMEMAAGHDYRPEVTSDLTNGVIINETGARALGWQNAQQAIGGRVDLIDRTDRTIIGVVKDFHYGSLHQPIAPLVMPVESGNFSTYITLNLKIRPGNLENVVASLDKTWSTSISGIPFSYQFLDEAIDRLYQREKRTASLFMSFAGLAIFLACLGLFGLAAYTARRRTKEIGIRKVLGATVANIVGLLSKDFLKLVALGFVIAVPIAWYAMNQWLADFAYRITIGSGIFLLAGGLALVIALVTVSWQSIRAALANPVDSLRSE